ncbi:Flp family type IVb pilin [Alteriqipengyuania sp. WL0013]|uniref:Flp family type IVb pilin n=1 Tax=Alteriqipengyuania sp. WL0013 TaxID=3110773 RepID=UPI002CE72179|nr:Flp family type IVb pilin [Alteriqipengyuania sp. WL0013]MEB3415219.1 Flp family type IVb pilin [Alteriqipengyuania sp. WL0013]
MFNIIKSLGNDEKGATAVEYGLIVALIVVAIIGAVKGVADENNGMWATVNNKTAVAHGTV